MKCIGQLRMSDVALYANLDTAPGIASGELRRDLQMISHLLSRLMLLASR